MLEEEHAQRPLVNRSGTQGHRLQSLGFRLALIYLTRNIHFGKQIDTVNKKMNLHSYSRLYQLEVFVSSSQTRVPLKEGTLN